MAWTYGLQNLLPARRPHGAQRAGYDFGRCVRILPAPLAVLVFHSVGLRRDDGAALAHGPRKGAPALRPRPLELSLGVGQSYGLGFPARTPRDQARAEVASLPGRGFVSRPSAEADDLVATLQVVVPRLTKSADRTFHCSGHHYDSGQRGYDGVRRDAGGAGHRGRTLEGSTIDPERDTVIIGGAAAGPAIGSKGRGFRGARAYKPEDVRPHRQRDWPATRRGTHREVAPALAAGTGLASLRRQGGVPHALFRLDVLCFFRWPTLQCARRGDSGGPPRTRTATGIETARQERNLAPRGPKIWASAARAAGHHPARSAHGQNRTTATAHPPRWPAGRASLDRKPARRNLGLAPVDAAIHHRTALLVVLGELLAAPFVHPPGARAPRLPRGGCPRAAGYVRRRTAAAAESIGSASPRQPSAQLIFLPRKAWRSKLGGSAHMPVSSDLDAGWARRGRFDSRGEIDGKPCPRHPRPRDHRTLGLNHSGESRAQDVYNPRSLAGERRAMRSRGWPPSRVLAVRRPSTARDSRAFLQGRGKRGEREAAGPVAAASVVLRQWLEAGG